MTVYNDAWGSDVFKLRDKVSYIARSHISHRMQAKYDSVIYFPVLNINRQIILDIRTCLRTDP